MVSTVDAVIVLGGRSDGENSNLIAQFKANVWTKVGELKQARVGHASIMTNNDIHVVGGGVAPE